MPEVWGRTGNGQAVALNQLKEVAAELIRKSEGVKVWLFSGEMGAGKTTLIKSICEQLGVNRGMSSPTFSIVNEYHSNQVGKIYHFDFYRLKQEQEAYDLGAEEYFDSGNYCFIEWPEKIPTLIPPRHMEIILRPKNDLHRMIDYTIHD